MEQIRVESVIARDGYIGSNDYHTESFHRLEDSQQDRVVEWKVDPEPRSVRGVSLIIPAHNEEARIEPTLRRYTDVLQTLPVPSETIVVSDGTDRTSEIAEKFSTLNVRVLRARSKMGKGGAILAGFREARYEITGYVDADGSLANEDLSSILTHMLSSSVDVIVGSRWLPESRWVHREKFSKLVASRVFNFMVRSLLLLNIRDTQCGAKFYRRPILNLLLSKVQVTNLTSDVGFLFHAVKNGAKVVEVPVTWDDDPRSTYNLPTMIPIMLLTLVGIRLMNLPIGRLVPQPIVRRLERFIEFV